MGDTNTFSYAVSTFFVGVGAVYAVLLVATLLSVLLIPIAFIITPFIIIFLIVWRTNKWHIPSGYVLWWFLDLPLIDKKLAPVFIVN